MTLADNLLERSSHVVGAVRNIGRMSRLSYSPADCASLVRAHRAKGSEADILGFHVNYLNGGSFRVLLEEIFFKGEYLFHADTDSPVIFDCGANIGLATLFFKHLYPAARISCFEADPSTAAVLQKNIEQNHLQDVSPYNLMLSNSEGEHPFYLAANMEGSLFMSALPDRLANHREIIVQAGKLSNYIDSPVDLLKLDVEGAEFDVMTDLKNTGKIAQIRNMMIEYHHRIDGQSSRLAQFLALLEDAGFEYQISAACYPISRQNVFQDILIGAYRPAAGCETNRLQ